MAGTTTPQDTFSDEALTVALPNPIRTNSAGRPQNASGTETNVYWSAASYRVDILTAGSDGTCSTGTTIYSADNIPAIPALAAAIDVTGTAGETILAGEVVYLSDGSGSLTAGRWYLADADNTYSSTTAGMVGVAPSNIASAASGSIRLQGRITGLSALTAGELYYVSATAGDLAATPPTNARFVAEADSTTSIVVSGNPGTVKLPDSNGTHSLVLTTTSDLTADRLLTFVPGDAARTVTISGATTISQDYSTAGSPQFTGVELGHATDTTLTRASAGVAAVEGSSIGLASNNLGFFAATTSAQLAGVISDEQGSGALVFATSPTFTTPVIGAATGTSLDLTNTSGFSVGTTVLDVTSGLVGIGQAGGTTIDGDSYILAVKRTGRPASFWEGTDDNTDRTLIAFHRKATPLSVGVISATNTTTTYATSSDAKLKRNIRPTAINGLGVLRQINVRDFNFIADEPTRTTTAFVAQELYEVWPRAVSTASAMWGVDEGKLMAPTIKAVQELDAAASAQEQRIRDLEARITALEAEVARLKGP